MEYNNILDLKKRIEEHDLYHMFSDSEQVYINGNNEKLQIKKISENLSEEDFSTLFNSLSENGKKKYLELFKIKN